MWPVELTWWRTKRWFCVLQTAPSGGCLCSGRGSTPPSPPSVEPPSTGGTALRPSLWFSPSQMFLHISSSIGLEPQCWLVVIRLDGVLGGVFSGVAECRFTDTWLCYRRQLQMWHNSEQREFCSLLNLNRTPTPWRNVQERRIKLSTLNDLLPLRRAAGAPRGKWHRLFSLRIRPSLLHISSSCPLFFFQTLFSEVWFSSFFLKNKASCSKSQWGDTFSLNLTPVIVTLFRFFIIKAAVCTICP